MEENKGKTKKLVMTCIIFYIVFLWTKTGASFCNMVAVIQGIHSQSSEHEKKLKQSSDCFIKEMPLT
jgi:hypothetical protein